MTTQHLYWNVYAKDKPDNSFLVDRTSLWLASPTLNVLTINKSPSCTRRINVSTTKLLRCYTVNWMTAFILFYRFSHFYHFLFIKVTDKETSRLWIVANNLLLFRLRPISTLSIGCVHYSGHLSAAVVLHGWPLWQP